LLNKYIKYVIAMQNYKWFFK